MPNRTKAEKTKRDTGMIAGLRKYFAGSTLGIRHKNYTVEEVVALFQQHLDALARVHALTIERSTAVRREEELEKKIVALTNAVKGLAKARVGESDPRLREFGVEPDKKPYMSAETKRRANEKRQETRRERGVMGKRQRKKLKAAAK